MTAPAVLALPPRDQRFHPEKIILFGSHAYGEPKPWSDVDLLVVMETELTPHKQRLEIARSLLPRPFGLDVLVRTPEDLKWRIEQGDFFLREIVARGKVVYEKTSAKLGLD
ncbi:MAG: nucleotidyltransferase domain-containing protein [Chloroflexi bacterium]|nr:nucleotidyltransferase domain-containing protein [Chloroflexota bacterium]